MTDLAMGYTAAAETAKGAAPPRIHKDMSAEKIRETAQEFEAFYLSQFLSTMFKGIKTDGMFGGGHGESVYREFQFQEYGKVIAKQGGLGISDAIVRQLLTTQEVKQP